MPTAGIQPRQFRYPQDKWDRVKALAEERHTSVTAIISRYLDTLIAKKKHTRNVKPVVTDAPTPRPERVVRRIDPSTCQHLNVKVLAMGDWCRDCGSRLRKH